MKKIKLENAAAVGLSRWLGGQPFKGQSSRMRTRFISLLTPQLTVIDEFRLSLVKEYAEVDKDGEYLKVEDQYGRVNYDLSPENLEVVNKKYEEKLKESFELEVGEDTEKSFNFISDYVLKTDYEFKGKEADDYDKWCEAFEQAS